MEWKFKLGSRVAVYGNPSFEGVVVGCIVKRDGKTQRYVVEDNIGQLEIFASVQLHYNG